VVPIDPDVISMIRASRVRDVPELWARELVEGPSFRTMFPEAAAGPFNGPLHFRRSKLARCPLDSAVHTTPFVSRSIPRDPYPMSGGKYTSASAVCGGLGPGTSRMMYPG